MNIRTDIEFVTNFAQSHRYFLAQGELYFIYNDMPIRFESEQCKNVITVEYQNQLSKLASRVRTLMDNIKSRALLGRIDTFDSIHNRVLQLNDRVIYDLCSGNDVIDIRPNGYSLQCKLQSSYLNLIPTGSSLQQVRPIPTGMNLIDMIRELTNFSCEEDLIMFGVWLISLMFPDFSSPIMILLGEQGSGKSFTSDLVKRIIDPSTIGKQHNLRSVQDFALLVSNSYLSIVDNLSKVTDEMSDAMCQTVSKGQYTTRTLYTNDEISTTEMKSKLVVNGITISNTKPDLLERSIVLNINKLSATKIISEEALNLKLDNYLPMVLDRIFASVSYVLMNIDSINLTKAPRLVDFAKLIFAIAESLGLDGEYVLNVYLANIDDVGKMFLDDPVVVALNAVLDSCNGIFEGTSTQLLEQMKQLGHEDVPRAANSLSSKLTRLSSELEKQSITIDRYKKDGGNRIIKISRI